MNMSERVRRNMTVERKLQEFVVRLPETVVSDLEEVATAFGFSTPHALVRAYISHGLREHLVQLDVRQTSDHTLDEFQQRLIAKGVSREAVAQVAEEMRASG